jgi:hypothetical protein
MKKILVHLIISFFKIHIKNQTTLFFPFDFMNYFMKRNHPIHDISAFNKIILKVTNHRSDATDQSIGQDFSNNLVANIEQTYRSEGFNVNRVRNFGNEGNSSKIKSFNVE